MSPTQRSAVIASLAIAAGATAVVWADEPQPQIPYGTAGLVRLTLFADRSEGEPDYLTSEDDLQPAGEELADGVVLRRLVTLRCKAEMLTQSPTAETVLSDVREGLALRSINASLQTVNVAIVSVAATTMIEAYQDGRTESVASCDVFLSYTSLRTDPVRYGWIEQIELTETVLP